MLPYTHTPHTHTTLLEIISSYLAFLLPAPAQKQELNSQLLQPLKDPSAGPAGSDLGSKDAGWLLPGEPWRKARRLSSISTIKSRKQHAEINTEHRFLFVIFGNQPSPLKHLH